MNLYEFSSAAKHIGGYFFVAQADAHSNKNDETVTVITVHAVFGPFHQHEGYDRNVSPFKIHLTNRYCKSKHAS